MKFQAAVENWVDHLLSHKFKERVLEEDPTMLKHVPILAEINRHGFITNNSQAGRKYSYMDEMDKQRYDHCERAYLEGFMLQSKAALFIKEMALHTDKVAHILHSTTDKTTLDLPSSLNTPVTVENERTRTHMPNIVSDATWHRLRKQSHINKSERIVWVSCYDLTWNRSAVGPKGLFKEVLKILKKIEDKPKNKTLKKKN
jgi:hypothetical protein